MAYEEVDRIDGFPLAQVPETIAGQILEIAHWDGNAWTPISVPLNVTIGSKLALAVSWQNNSDTEVRGHVDIAITLPNSITLALPEASGQEGITVASGDVGFITYNEFALNMAGSYEMIAILLIEAV